jgi:glycosyltransferase involved in cell wall biosynthesis
MRASRQASDSIGVSVGLPVYNGERYVAAAIESVLSQDYGDFELIISDNASRDGTDAICRKYAERDSRIRYIRQTANVGAAPNFNGIVARARGAYFKWMAHDDLIAPSFLTRCVEVLDADPTAVLAAPNVRYIDADGAVIREYTSPFRTDHPDPVVRFSETLEGHRCFEACSLIRIDCLKRSGLIRSYSHGDGALLSELALMGRFARVPEPLFAYRQHLEQTVPKHDHALNAHWFDTSNAVRPLMSRNRLLADYLKMVRASDLTAHQRWHCYWALAKWARRRWRGLGGEWKRRILGRGVPSAGYPASMDSAGRPGH